MSLWPKPGTEVYVAFTGSTSLALTPTESASYYVNMLAFSRSVCDDWTHFLTLSPREYLDDVRREKLNSFVRKFNEESEAEGYPISAAIRSGVIVIEVRDANALSRKLLDECGLSQEKANRLIRRLHAPPSAQIRRKLAIRDELVSFVEECVKLTGSDSSRIQSVPVDLVPANHFNAGAGPAPGRGDVVLLNEGFRKLFPWCEYQKVLNTEPKPDLEPTPSSIDELHAQRERLAPKVVEQADLDLQFVANILHPHTDPLSMVLTMNYVETDSTEQIKRQADWESSNILRFVILHEFGHIVLRHTDALRPPHGAKLSNAEKREFEFAADRYAAEALKKVLPVGDAIQAAVTLFLLFGRGETAKAKTHIDPPPELSDHPPAADRGVAVLEILLAEHKDRDKILSGWRDHAETSRLVREALRRPYGRGA